ncbi:3-hydroxybutyryl-CoA dehydrogenase [bacterium (Candidatus Blackallbacteria) CG17_big_fil_post_rev_8_21_14_2_50_48_46]|uniref:3-hydroxybutyryl-CoA dehydrogenase n=1 Tax=bacterium (Candidatus Blackallbacteria) CG17_big_fil_post_rev_8_21_14_2_50_48_46 TaxID=2014261 RepID=A0A2M7G893_9BACT|nr:MAG: 3-hydroxybutyryl-CoA dehydrogenase [bacterium (Candidatus Blackallbacteria) CG18_big_fil_WC_8_21_14_2_50_49_26]PIW18305.1 MAG: 3-hydroxybutyryl-CoA dehydrogenase [bacterium (Candidatus Blackallbacteria) CG17_big_fil_post_rev_8_21_14_2_50_48_46]PIW49529.1 MAG: 3-hydroxybutyryl-CoA dehydrogenase [bacterium (Candidatus Blackallbacteria) CG13_big_fil_rev_8_21_14_2_50_49_14]
MQISKVFVAGSGLMGGGIAHAVSAVAGLPVTVYDISDEVLAKSRASHEKLLQKMAEKGKLEADQIANILERVSYTTSLQAASEAQLVIEAIPEKLELKKALFAQLESICPAETLFASNTSSLPITSLASATQRGDRFIGMHFFSPVHLMKLLELIRGLETSEETFQTLKAFGEKLGKQVIVANDFPGFITTRLGMVLLNEAMYALMEGVGSPEDIDAGMKLGFNHPMGPLALADAVGLDVCLNAMNTLQEGFGNPKYAPCPLLKRLVQAGHLGKKTGRGFYTYA